MKQNVFAGVEAGSKKRVTRRERFLALMQQVVPWQRLAVAIEPHWPRGEGEAAGRRTPLEPLLRLHFVQQWYGLGDEALEDALHDSAALARFVGLEPAALPAAAERCEFRRLLEGRPPLRALLGEIDAQLRRQGLVLRQGRIVEAALGAVDAPAPHGG